MMGNFLKNEENDLRGIFDRFRKRNFTGDTGQAIKNSSYQLTTNVVMKLGSLVFTIVIARMLLPELFGLYSLALATVVLFSSFADMGIGSALITFVSKSLGQGNEKKAKAYFKKLLRWQTILVTIIPLILIGSSYFIANSYYNKPIFYALLVGAFYIPLIGFESFFENLFRANNKFKIPLIKEIIFQISRLTIIPLTIFILLKINLGQDLITAGIILSVNIVYFIGVLYLFFTSKKNIIFIKLKTSELNKKETNELKKFIVPLTATALSGIFFGYIDTIMLGHFVTSAYIGFYGVALGLVGSVSAVVGFSAISFFPLFSKLEKISLEKIFKKGRNLTILISLLAGIATYFLSYIIVEIAYGKDYLNSVPILKYFVILIILLPLTGIYEMYFISQKRTKPLAFLLVISTILNIILNFTFISYGIKFGQLEAVLGACFATIISRGFYWVGLVILKKRTRTN